MDHSWVLKWVWILLYWMNLLSLKGCRCLCKDLIPLLLIRCFHEVAIRQDQHQCCTFICGALICSSVKIVSLLLRRVWHSEFGPPWQSSLSCFSKFSHTFICTIAAKLTSFFPLHQKDLFIKSSPSSIPVTADDFPLSSFCWIWFCLESCWMCYVGWFTSFSLPLFFKADILALGGILFFLLHNCSILVD